MLPVTGRPYRVELIVRTGVLDRPFAAAVGGNKNRPAVARDPTALSVCGYMDVIETLACATLLGSPLVPAITGWSCFGLVES